MPRSLICTGIFYSVFLSGNFDHNQINSIIPTKVTSEAIAGEQVKLKITTGNLAFFVVLWRLG
jgi:hypothetical protein